MSDGSILGGSGLSREELLGGMPARRASTILFAIENLTHSLVSRSRHALARYQPAESAKDRERRFIDAVSGGREDRVRPLIQDIERYAKEWAYLVPDVPEIKAQVLYQLSTRYPLVYERTPRVRTVLGIDSPGVATAFHNQQSREISTVFTPERNWRERMRWWRAGASERLETMPPFWMAFSLTLTETVGGGMLAIPIALAWVGVPIGLLFLAVFALISIVTIAALVEAITRDGNMRYGNGYFGRMAQNRLGKPGSVTIGIGLLLLEGISLLAAMFGFGTVLGEQTGVAPMFWVAILFVVILLVLRRENLGATIAAALIVGIVILALAGGMIVLGLINSRPTLLSGAGAEVGDVSGGTVVALVFGVLLYVYFGHTSAGNAARQVLRRDPTGRTLLWGNVTAMAAAAVVYMLFVLAVNGSVPAERLAAETGTAITPLEEVAGPAVGVMGILYVILSLGIGAVYGSLGLYLQAAERLGSRAPASASTRFLIAVIPVATIFALLVLLMSLGLGSFIGPLNLVGALVVPVLGGVFPMLLIASSRRRGERVPGTPLRWLGSPLVVAVVVALYLGGVVAHALIIWTGPVERIAATVTALAIVTMILLSVRRHAFAPRTVVELREDEPPGTGMTVAVVADGRGVSEDHFPDITGIDSVSVVLPHDRPVEVFVWAHQPTRNGDTQPLEVDVDMDQEQELVVRLPKTI